MFFFLACFDFEMINFFFISEIKLTSFTKSLFFTLFLYRNVNEINKIVLAVEPKLKTDR